MTLPDSLRDIAGTGLEPAWTVSREGDAEDELPWLEPKWIRSSLAWVGLPEEAVDDCLEAAHRVQANAHLRRFAAGAHHILFRNEGSEPRAASWPVAITALGEWTGPFYLLLGLSGIPGARAFLEGRGLSEDEARHCCHDLAIWGAICKDRGFLIDGAYRHPGPIPRWSISPRNLGWCHRVLIGNTIRLGRLQFIHRVYNRPFRAYRNRGTGQVHLLAEDGTQFTSGGRVLREGTPAWVATLDKRQGSVTGIPVVDGYGSSQLVELDLREWSEVLRPGDPILEIHIPEDGPMDFDLCSDSLVQARDRFGDLFPDRPFNVFGCFSWLLDPHLQQILPATSNIVRFQRACHLFPLVEGDGRGSLSRIFHTEDLAAAPASTSLQRAVLEHMVAGGGLYGGGAIICPEDLPWESREKPKGKSQKRAP